MPYNEPESLPIKNYILDIPRYQSAVETYPEAADELLRPFPSTNLAYFPKLNKLTGGLRPKEFTILCGATGVGKTTFNANLSKSLLTGNVPHFVASVETGPRDFLKRTMSAYMSEDWNTGDPISLERVKTFHSRHGHLFQKECLFLSLYENRFKVETLMSDMAWMIEEKKCKVAIIDNLNFFLEVTRASDQIVEMDRVIHELIIFCKSQDIHVIMVMHPKKTDNGRVENEFDIKGSSTAVQEAHNIFLLNRPGADLIEKGHATAMDRELKIVKMRRKGRAVGARLVLTCVNGVEYTEGALLT